MSIVKLVRDGIIKRIREKGETANYWQTAGEELKLAAVEKLVEEATELKKAIRDSQGREKVLEEAADVQEAFEKCREVLRLDIADIMQRQAQKRREYGGFEGDWMLELEEA